MTKVSIKKNYYELKRVERREYLEEYNDISYIKRMKNKKDFILYLLFMFLVMTIVSNYVDFNLVLPYFDCYLKCGSILILIYYIFLESYYRVSFMRWLKIKHKVEY